MNDNQQNQGSQPATTPKRRDKKSKLEHWFQQASSEIVIALVGVSIWAVIISIVAIAQYFSGAFTTATASTYAFAGLGLVLTTFAAIFSGTISSQLNQHANRKQISDIIKNYLREGVEEVAFRSTPGSLDKLIQDAKDTVRIIRPFTDPGTALPYKEIVAALRDGVDVLVVLPTENNNYVFQRLSSLYKEPREEIELRRDSALKIAKMDLKKMKTKCGDNNTYGKLIVKQYEGQFTMNLVGDGKAWYIAIPWAHEFASEGPQICVNSSGLIGKFATSHFERVWKESAEIRELCSSHHVISPSTAVLTQGSTSALSVPNAAP